MCRKSKHGKHYPLVYIGRLVNTVLTKGSFIEQLKGDATCDNNFECSSNLCVNSQSVGSGLFEKITE